MEARSALATPAATTSTGTAIAESYPSTRYAWWVVIVLMVCYTLSFIDRQIMGFLVAPIRRDLGITDTQVGLLGGLAFALFYTFLGLPMGWLADRFNRRNIVGSGVVAWSLATAVCAATRSFGSLFVARMGVGVGEATLAPAAFSLISDIFPKDRLATALSVYSMGILIGSGVASILGGLIVQAVSSVPSVTVPLLGAMAPWRVTFLVVGLPGMLVALLLFTVREPLRRDLLRCGSTTALPARVAFAEIAKRWSSVVGVSTGLGCTAMTTYAVNFWAPPFFTRVHGWPPAQIGLALGSTTIVFGCLGSYLGGRLCDRWLREGKFDAPVRIGMIGNMLTGVAGVAAMLSPNGVLAVVFLAPVVFFCGFPIGSTYASLQWIFPNQVRGIVSAILIFLINAVGLTLGPLLPGLFNDRVFGDGAMVAYSLAMTLVIASVAGTLIFRMTFAPYRRDYGALRAAA